MIKLAAAKAGDAKNKPIPVKLMVNRKAVKVVIINLARLFLLAS